MRKHIILSCIGVLPKLCRPACSREANHINLRHSSAVIEKLKLKLAYDQKTPFVVPPWRAPFPIILDVLAF